MNIAIIGYGRMGHEIEAIALERGHTVGLKVDLENAGDLNAEKLKNIDVAIEFSTPSTALTNIEKCLGIRVPVVSGTTGWLDDYPKAAEACKRNGTAFIHSTNFSIGVNLLFLLSRELAGRMEQFRDYRVSIEEIHHVKKLDAPSGTAITLAEGISARHAGYDGWCNEGDTRTGCVHIRSVREAMVPGTHTVTWDSPVDTLSLKHEAKNRKGLALGAVVAAEYIHNRSGVFTMNDVMGF